MPAPRARQLLEPPLTAASFRRQLMAVLQDTRLLWMPQAGDTTTALTFETNPGRTVTYDATVAARLSPLGRGYGQTFVSASTQYGTTPDTANLSFGDGTTDQAFSAIALANVTDTAAARTFLSKWSGAGGREWAFDVLGTDVLRLICSDESAGQSIFRTSDAAITMGSPHLFVATYDGRGGTTAANGITLYQDGAIIASTANSAAYTAMENLAAACEIGSLTVHTANFLDGALALAALAAKLLTAADIAAIVALCRRFYGVPA